MGKRKGFLLIECIVSFGILSFAVLLFAQFFSQVISCYQEAQDRLYALQIAQNSIEQMWQGNQLPQEKGDVIIQVKQWPILAAAPADLPDNKVRLVYQAVQVSKRVGKPMFTLSGYLYEAV